VRRRSVGHDALGVALWQASARPCRHFAGSIAIALPDLLRYIGASRGLQIPSRRTLSPYWKPRHARGFSFHSREDGNSILDYVAAAADFVIARAAYRAACRRWPEAKITLRQGARVVERN